MKKLILILSVAFCLQSARADTTIGVIAPLSGEIRVWGEGIKGGLEVAKIHTKSPLRYLYEDEGFCDVKRSVAAAKRLIEQHNVKYLIASCHNGLQAILPMAKSKGVLVFASGFIDEETLEKSEHVATFATQIGAEARFLAQEIQKRGIKNLTFFRHDDTFTAEFFKRFSEKAGTAITIRDVAVSDAQFPWVAELAKLKLSPSEAYVTYLGNDQLLGFLRAKNDLQDTTPLFSGYMTEGNFDAEKFGDLLNGVTYSFPKLARDSDPQRQVFENSYSTMFGEKTKPIVNSYFVYDGMQLLADAITNCPENDTSCVYSYMTKPGNSWHGISGECQYSFKGAIERSFVMKRVVGGRFVEVE